MSNDFEIVAPDRKTHRGQLEEMFARSFAWQGYWGALDFARGAYFDEGFYDSATSRSVMLGDELISHFGVFDCPMRIGSARVKVAGVGAVMTHGDYRRRGLMTKAGAASIKAMSDAGYDMSLLFGKKDVYTSLGYVSAWSTPMYYANVTDLPLKSGPAKLKAFSPGSRGELGRLYNRQSAGLTGTAVRPTWTGNPYPKLWKGYLLQDESGKVAGYVVWHLRHGRVQHVDSAGDARQILGALARIAKREGVKEIDFYCLHYNSRLAKLLRRGDCRLELNYTAAGDAMVRTVNLHSTLTKMSDELLKRLANSRLAGWCGELLIADARQKVFLTIGRSKITVSEKSSPKTGKVKHAISGGEHIVQLLIGTDEPLEIADAGKIRFKGDGESLAEALFPQQHPTLSAWDRF